MSFNKYFQDELTALRELGKEFAHKNPRLAPFLDVEAQDPDVERLLEGFAFLTGRLRQKLDDELPELSHSVMNLLWPNFLKPVPAMSVVEFQPTLGLNEKKKLDRGIYIDSKKVDGTICRFRTCYDVDIYPLTIKHVQYEATTKGSQLSIDFKTQANLPLVFLNLDKIRLFLTGEMHVSQSLLLWMHRYLTHIDIVVTQLKGDDVIIGRLPSKNVSQVGFKEEEKILPYSENTFPGYRYILEYFSIPEKYQFIDITGLKMIYTPENIECFLNTATNIKLVFHYNRALESHIKPSKDNIKLYCTPVVNIFEHEAKPIWLDHKKTEYRIIPESADASHYEIYQILKVEGRGRVERSLREYKRFESFEHARNIDADKAHIYYKEQLRSSVYARGLDSYLSFVSHQEQHKLPDVETVSIALLATNRDLPLQLNVGDINVNTSSTPEFVTFSNITQVTPAFSPPLDQGVHWRLISNMSLNYTSLVNPDALRIILSTYDLRSYYDRQHARASQQRLEGIEQLKSEGCDYLFNGRPIRGLKTTMYLRESKFASEGDMYIFASVLNEFLSLYCSINSFHWLNVYGIEQGEYYQWQPRLGQQPLL